VGHILHKPVSIPVFIKAPDSYHLVFGQNLFDSLMDLIVFESDDRRLASEMTTATGIEVNEQRLNLADSFNRQELVS
jgi:hypothetical protein